jgi:hypothetical protein
MKFAEIYDKLDKIDVFFFMQIGSCTTIYLSKLSIWANLCNKIKAFEDSLTLEGVMQRVRWYQWGLVTVYHPYRHFKRDKAKA